MDLKRVTIKIESDGIRLIDKGAGLEPGTPLTVQYELSGGWTTKEVEFEREAATLFHPFRKSMFVYTGSAPSRVLVRLRDGGFTDPIEHTASTGRRRYYEERNFRTYPDFDDDAWDADDYRPVFSSVTPHHTSHSQPTAEGRIEGTVPSSSVPPPLPTGEPASSSSGHSGTFSAAEEPLERDVRQEQSADARLGAEVPDFNAPLEAESPSSSGGGSGNESSEPLEAASSSFDAGSSSSSSSEPNAY